MGQGQEIHARRIMASCFQEGDWMLMQNCHLSLDYVVEVLDTILDTEHVHDSFRLWVTTEEHAKFPINFLQVSQSIATSPCACGAVVASLGPLTLAKMSQQSTGWRISGQVQTTLRSAQEKGERSSHSVIHDLPLGSAKLWSGSLMSDFICLKSGPEPVTPKEAQLLNERRRGDCRCECSYMRWAECRSNTGHSVSGPFDAIASDTEWITVWLTCGVCVTSNLQRSTITVQSRRYPFLDR